MHRLTGSIEASQAWNLVARPTFEIGARVKLTPQYCADTHIYIHSHMLHGSITDMLPVENVTGVSTH